MSDLRKAIEAARELRANIAALLHIEEAGDLSVDDLKTLDDSFEGETTLDVELAKAIEGEDDDKILVDGITTRINELTARRDRLKKRVEARRGLIEQAMVIAGWTKHETPLGTVSLGKAPAKVEIEDESIIPHHFWKRADPTVDKTLLGKTLKELHKEIEEMLAIEDAGKRSEVLLAFLTGDFLPLNTERVLWVDEARKINDPEERCVALHGIINRFALIPGVRLETDRQTLTIRRR